MILRAIALQCQQEVGSSHKSGYARNLGCDFARANSDTTATSRNPYCVQTHHMQRHLRRKAEVAKVKEGVA